MSQRPSHLPPDDTPVVFDRVRRFLGVMSRNSVYPYFDKLRELAVHGGRWLEVGCGRRVIPEWMIWTEAQRRALLESFPFRAGADLDHEYMSRNTEIDHKVVCPLERLAIADESFDLVTANMVVEHVADPRQALREVARVLRPGGRFLFHTPNVLYPLMLAGFLANRLLPGAVKDRLVSRIEGRAERDVFPTLYRLNTPGSIRRAARAAGLEVAELNLVESIPSSMRRAAPLAISELIFIWLTRVLRLRVLRSNLIVVLQKPLAARP